MGADIFYLENKMGYSDIIPLSVGNEICEAGHLFGPHIKTNYSFHYIVKGKGVFGSRGKTYELSAGDCFCICQGERVMYAADAEDPWHYIWIGFKGMTASRVKDLEKPVFHYEKDTFMRLYDRLCDGKHNSCDLAISALFEIFSSIDSAKSNGNDYIQSIKNCIAMHYADGITIENVADTVGLNRHYLTSLFRSETGMTAIEYLSDVRLSEAFRLLREGYSVNEATFMVGYSDQFHFSKMFKRKFGISPSTVKKESKNGSRKTK